MDPLVSHEREGNVWYPICGIGDILFCHPRGKEFPQSPYFLAFWGYMLSFAVLIGSFKLFKNNALIPKDKFFCSLDHEISCTNLMLDTYFIFVCF